jgi:glycosyltransferase involved in cell wall biosynthesis
MRIVFICSCLEPGKDGVGDYTRRLAGELIRQGHQAAVVALNDGYVSAPRIEAQEAEGVSIQALRLPRNARWGERIERARSWVDAHAPDWVSLQFVCFGFHPKGLPFGLGRRLRAVAESIPWHIMFHELWVGDGDGVGWKKRFWGRAQRWIIGDLVKRLRPARVHSHTATYIHMLSHLGVKAGYLPLFGSIPEASDIDRHSAFQVLAEHGHEHREGAIIGGVFGAIHPEWDPDRVLASLQKYANTKNRRLVLVAFGRHGPAGERCLANIRARWSGQFELVELGALDDRVISGLLSMVHLGLATSPWALIGKSATAAAFLDFGVPVIVTRDDAPSAGDDPLHTEDLLIRFTGGDSLDWASLLRKRKGPSSRLKNIAGKLVADLEEAGGQRQRT